MSLPFTIAGDSATYAPAVPTHHYQHGHSSDRSTTAMAQQRDHRHMIDGGHTDAADQQRHVGALPPYDYPTTQSEVASLYRHHHESHAGGPPAAADATRDAEHHSPGVAATVSPDPPPSSGSVLADESVCSQAQPHCTATASGSGCDHEQMLQAMQRQFATLERAFHTLQGLCRVEIRSIEGEQKRLAATQAKSMSRFQDHAAQHGIVKLNVGGSRFNVSHTTLLKYPGSLFDVLLQGNFPIELDDQGYIFVDRDAELFRELLHFLRTGDTGTIRMLPQITRSRVMEEAKYFGFDQLLMELRSTRLEWVSETAAHNVYGDIPAPRCFAAGQYVGNGTVYLFGGCTANDLFFDTLYMIKSTPVDTSGGDASSSAPHGDRPDGSSPYLASSIGAGGGTTALQQQQQQLYYNHSTPSASSPTAMGGRGVDPAEGPSYHQGAPTVGVGAAAAVSCPTAYDGALAQASQHTRPERFEFTLIRPRGEVCPPARSGHAMVYLQGHLLLLYGNDKSGHVHDVYSFNTFTHTWSVLTCRGDYVEPRSGHSVTVLHDKLWLIGGKQIFPTMKSFGDIFEATVDVDAETLTWRRVQPVAVLPEGAVVEKRGYHSTATYGNSIVIHGGIVRDVYCSDVCFYDVVRNVWRCLMPGDPPAYVPSQPRSGHIASVHGDQMYVFGSYSEDHPQLLLYSFCLTSYVWKRVHATGRGPARRAAPSGILLPHDPALALLPRLLIFGGFDIASRKCFNDVFTVTL